MLRGILALLLLFGASCASTGAGNSNPERDTIYRTEIEQRGAANAYELIQAARPQWLRLRVTPPQNVSLGQCNGRNCPAPPADQGVPERAVYLNNAKMGGRQALREIPLASVQYIRFYDAPAANHRWGSGHSQGAILVSTEPPPPQ